MPPIKIIGMPITAPIPVSVRTVPTIIFSNPTAFLVGFQKSGKIRKIRITTRVRSINQDSIQHYFISQKNSGAASPTVDIAICPGNAGKGTNHPPV